MHREESDRSQRGSHVPPDLWALSIELSSFHSSGIWNLEVAALYFCKNCGPLLPMKIVE